MRRSRQRGARSARTDEERALRPLVRRLVHDGRRSCEQRSAPEPLSRRQQQVRDKDDGEGNGFGFGLGLVLGFGFGLGFRGLGLGSGLGLVEG